MRKKINRYNSLTSVERLGKNTFLNLTAKILPLFVGLFAIPVLIESLGETRFGFLALIWLLIGYFSMFNLGMSPAIVRLLSAKISNKEYQEIPKVVWTGILFITLMGIIAGVLLFSLSEWLTFDIFEIDSKYSHEVNQSLIYTSFAIPLIISTSGFKAVMESLQKFKVISLLQGLNSLLNYLLPLLIVVYITDSLVWVVASLLLVKLLMLIAFIIEALKVEKSLRNEFKLDYSYLKEMIGFGKWVTVSNVVGPLMGQLDRYFIGSFLSVSAVTYYTTPLEMLSKVMIIPSSAIAVLFPAFSTLSGASKVSNDQLLIRSTRAIFVLIFPVLLLLAFIAPFGLQVWLGDAFEERSKLVAQLFCLVYLIRGVGFIFSTFLQGVNRPDLTAKFHLFEILIFCGALYYISGFGDINYIAMVALGITIVDSALLLWAVLNEIDLKRQLVNQIVIPLLIGCIIIVSIIMIESYFITTLIVVATLILFLSTNYSFVKQVIEKLIVKKE